MSRNTKKLPFGKRIAKSFRSGVIVSALMRFADALYKAARTSFAARIFLSYDKVNDCAERSLIGSATHSLSSSESESFRKVKHKFASSIENSFFISAIGKLYSSLLITSLASYGVFAFSFGFYVVATYLLKKYSFDIEVNTASLATGIALIAISVVLFMSKKSLAQAISGSVMLRFIFFDVLNLRSVSVDYAAAQPAYTGISVSFLVGMISGTVCDGAKPSCATKIASAVEAGLLGFDLYESGKALHGGDGILKGDVEKTIESVGQLAREGMRETDEEILDIMLDE